MCYTRSMKKLSNSSYKTGRAKTSSRRTTNVSPETAQIGAVSEIMRINKYLAHQGIATRRSADDLIVKGLVTINGRKALLGDKVSPTDTVEILTGKTPKSSAPKLFYYVYNKATGETVGNQNDGKKFFATFPGSGLFLADQIDKRDSGLLIITNDGRLTSRFLKPEYKIEREYEVTTRNHIRENFREKVASGLTIDGRVFEPEKIKVVGDNTFIISIASAGRHEIQSLLSILFNDVEILHRIRIANIRLGKLPVGTFRPIEGDEKEEFLHILGLV